MLVHATTNRSPPSKSRQRPPKSPQNSRAGRRYGFGVLHASQQSMSTGAVRALGTALAPALTNPYLNRWVEICAAESARVTQERTPTRLQALERNARMQNVRRELVKKYSFAIPNDQAIETICSYGPILEIGGGTGYWASLVRENAGDIVVYDIRPPASERSTGANRFHGNEGCWTEVREGTEAVIPLHPGRTLLLGWPPFEEPLALRSLTLYEGDHFLYIGALPLANGWKGPMGSDGFLDALASDWRLVKSVKLPNWPLCWDALHVFRRQASLQFHPDTH